MGKNNADNPFGRQYYQGIIAEVTTNTSGLGAADHETLRRYYHVLSFNETLRPFYRYNWLRRTWPMVHLLQTLPHREKPWRILDAGCGVGTESLLWASLRDDAEVVGVDISPERLQTAMARRPYYEQQVERALAVEFRDQNIFSIVKEKLFDLVWTMEAISHIDPAEGFIEKVAGNLNTPGYLVISDSHKLSPAMVWRIYRMRQRGKAEQGEKTLSTGEVIPYAHERLFAVSQLKQILQNAGFKTIQSQLSVFFPAGLATHPPLFKLGMTLDKILNRIPLFRNMGGIYTITAGK